MSLVYKRCLSAVEVVEHHLDGFTAGGLDPADSAEFCDNVYAFGRDAVWAEIEAPTAPLLPLLRDADVGADAMDWRDRARVMRFSGLKTEPPAIVIGFERDVGSCEGLYIIDGRHRLAAAETAGWPSRIGVIVPDARRNVLVALVDRAA